MANCQMSPQEFIQNYFSPMVAVLTTPGVEEMCQKNNLSFLQLIRPFSQLGSEAHYKDPSNNPVTVKNLRITFCDAQWSPPPPLVARTCFNEAVSSTIHEKTLPVSVGNLTLDTPTSVPWYEAWRNTFFQVQCPWDHEFTKHYVGCLLVVSTVDKSPLERLAEIVDKLQGLLAEAPNKLPKWFGPGSFVISAYLLLHDNSSGPEGSESTFELMKTTYGTSRCFFMAINSKTPDPNEAQLPDPWAQYISSTQYIIQMKKSSDIDSPTGIETAQEAGEKPQTPSEIPHPLSPMEENNELTSNDRSPEHLKGPIHHGACISAEDINRIRVFINDFIIKALIPHFEQHIQLLSDQISNKKGVSRSLLSATKRWFGTNKPGLSPNNIPPTSIAYSSDCHELQLRRLGDLCFMIGNYNLAFNAYHSAKRDFSADGAWLHYAGALEMAALSAFMSNNESLAKKVYEYAEDSINTYLTSCRMPQFATRATILSVECLKGKHMYGEAANQLIRMTSEDSDLRSAVLLEQAAYCFLSSRRPTMFRKYAFHMVMSGHRYTKAGHKNHSIRCYLQAYQVYKNRDWNVSEDHINYNVAKQSASLKNSMAAVKAFTKLVTRSSRQAQQQQLLFLKDYIAAVKQFEENTEEVPKLAIPIIEMDNFQILLNKPFWGGSLGNGVQATGVHFYSNLYASQPADEIWPKMEESLVSCAQGPNAIFFRPTVELLTKYTDNSSMATVVKNETVCVQVALRNPLQVTFKVQNLHLLWSLIPDDGGLCSSQNTNDCIVESISELTLLPETTKNVHLSIAPCKTGELHLTGLSYTLVDTSGGGIVTGMQPLLIIPRKATSKGSSSIDKRLQMIVVQKAPHLKIKFDGLKEECFSDEIIPVDVTLRCEGEAPITRLLVATTNAFDIWTENQIILKRDAEGLTIFEIPLQKPLDGKNSLKFTTFIRVMTQEKKENLNILFYYEGASKEGKFKYRLVRHSWPLTIYNYVNFSASLSKSNCCNQLGDLVNIRMKASNCCSDDSVFQFKLFLASISLFSLNWKLKEKLVADCSKPLEPSETSLLMARAFKKRLWTEEEKNSSEPSLSTMKISGKDGKPLVNFIHPPKLEDYPEISLIIIFNWVAELTYSNGKTVSVNGQSHLTASTSRDPVIKSPSLEAEEKENQTTSMSVLSSRAVKCMIDAPKRLDHDFKKNRICNVTIGLLLNNVSDRSLSVNIAASSNTQDSHSDGCIIWIGKTLHRLELKPNQSVILKFTGAATAPGAFSLTNRFTVLASLRNDASEVEQVDKNESTLAIF